MGNYSEKEINQASVFIERMLPYMEDGLSFEEAGKKVLERDVELMLIATSSSQDGDSEEAVKIADEIRGNMATKIYNSVNAA